MTKSTPYTQSGQALANQQQAAVMPRKQMEEHWAFVNARMGQLAKFVTGGLKPEALLRFLMIDLQQSEKLRQCSKESIYLALLACAVTGLEPGALKGEAYLVPFAREAQFMVGWRGIVKQARRAGISRVTPNVVRERDVFELDLGTANKLVHRPAPGDRGDVVGAYAIATIDGHDEIEFMDRADLDRIRKVAESRGKSPAWKDWPDQMARKSPIRRLGKRLPLGTDYFAGVALDLAAEDGNQKQVLDVLTEGAVTESGHQLARAPQMATDTAGGPITDEEAAQILAMEKQNED